MFNSKTIYVDHNTALCLACSSSLPPLKAQSFQSDIFTTSCCQRPICPSCIASNPRLARYNPCLSCLGGVDVVSASSTSRTAQESTRSPRARDPNAANLDGAVRDEDTFVLGDDEDDSDLEEDTLHASIRPSPPPSYRSPSTRSSLDARFQTIADHDLAATAPISLEPQEAESTPPENGNSAPTKYYISRNDTLQGIALRFSVNGYDLCKLNHLPPSTLSTTPHLIHTRSFLTLPPSAKPHVSSHLSPEEEKEREAKRARERAEKRLQTLTKEVDWRVAKAYVALADDAGEQDAFVAKRKESGMGGNSSLRARAGGSSSLEAAAVERYLDDEEWEAMERREGRDVVIPRFTVAGDGASKGKAARSSAVDDRKWWQWKS